MGTDLQKLLSLYPQANTWLRSLPGRGWRARRCGCCLLLGPHMGESPGVPSPGTRRAAAGTGEHAGLRRWC